MQESLREYVAAYNTLISLKKTEDSMMESNGELDSTVVSQVDNTAETLAAFEMQSQEFQKTQSDFEEYMERLKDDIDLKAEKFGYIEYYDAKLRDGYSHDAAVASKEINELDDRRKVLASVNPLFAKTTELPPQPNIEPITFEHISLNLPVIAKAALEELNGDPSEEVPRISDGFSGADGASADEPSDGADDEDDMTGAPLDGEPRSDDDGGDEHAGDDDDDGWDDEEEDEEDEEDEEEDEPLTREDLEAMSDDELKEVLDYLEIEYTSDNFDRDEGIEAVLQAQDDTENE